MKALFPDIIISLFHINVVHALDPPLWNDKGAQNPVHDTDDQGTEHCRPETYYLKTGYNPGGHFEEERIDHECKKAEGQDIDRQGQNEQDGAKKDVQNTQDGGRQKGTKKTGYPDSFDKVGCHHNGRGQDQPLYEDSFHGR